MSLSRDSDKEWARIKKYVRPADPSTIAIVKENKQNNARRLLQQIDAGADINAGTADGMTARAAIYGHANMVRFFLERGAYVEAKTASGGTALSGARDRRLWNMGGKQHVEVVALPTQVGAAQRAVR